MFLELFKKISLIIILVLVFHSLLFSAGALKWETDWESSLKTAIEKKQPVFIKFYTDWCPPCKRMAAVTFKDAGMIDYLIMENFLMIKINPEKDRVAESKFKVYSYPTMVVFKADGKELDRILGYQSPKDLIGLLDNLKKGIGTLDDLLGKLEKFKKDDSSDEKFKLIFKIIDKYIARADYPDALKLVDSIIALDKNNAKKQAAAALFQSGYIYYKWKKFQKAIDVLISVHKTFPGSEQAEEAFGAAAYYADKTKDKKIIRNVLELYLKTFPKGKYAEKFKKKMQKIGK